MGECIDAFRRQLIENKIYMGWQDKRRFNRYVRLAKTHAALWKKKDVKGIEKCHKKILCEIKWLAERTGREKEYEQLNKN